jgi:hypothetical protein
MTIPKINGECFLAQLSKSCQTDPDKFASEYMMKLTKEQPEMMGCIVAMTKPLTELGDKDEEIPAPIAAEMTLMSVFCVLGVVLESISATLDAKEMNEAWK